jgi:hypothetical protein
MKTAALPLVPLLLFRKAIVLEGWMSNLDISATDELYILQRCSGVHRILQEILSRIVRTIGGGYEGIRSSYRKSSRTAGVK